MRTVNNPPSLRPDVDSEDMFSKTCICGHAEEWHQPLGEWCEGPCEHDGCGCQAFRDFADEGEERWPLMSQST